MVQLPSVQELVRAIATCAREAEGFLTKTKLLKILYLLDVEFYRKHAQMLTQFRYVFYKYGPWDPGYDSLLSEMTDTGLIRINAGTRRDLDTQFVDTVKQLSPDQIFKRSEDLWLFKQVVSPWLDLPTSRILDYVYFSTEPMIDAQRDDELDFSKIDRTMSRYIREPRHQVPVDRVKAMRAKIAAAIKKPNEQEIELMPSPRFDQVYWDSVAIADADD